MANKKAILGIIATMMLVGLAGAGTWAYFSASAGSAGNSITAGTMTLGESTSAPFIFTNVVPGNSIVYPTTGSEITLTADAKNAAPGTLSVTLSNQNGQGTEMYKDMLIYIKNGAGADQLLYNGATDTISPVTLDSSFTAGKIATCNVGYHYINNPNAAQVQGGQLTFDLKFDLVQNVV